MEPSQAIRFTVRGTPRALPRARHVGRGRPVSIIDGKARLYRQALERAAREAAGQGEAWHGAAVRVEIVAIFPTPRRERWDRPHTHKPDADNVAKMALDGMQAAGLLARGDERAAEVVCRKLWGERGLTVITMTPVQGGPVAGLGTPTEGDGWLGRAQQSVDS